MVRASLPHFRTAWLCLGRSWGRLAQQFDPGTGPRQLKSPYPLLCPWNVHSTWVFCSQKPPQVCNLKTMITGWDHLDCVGVWTLLRCLYKLLRFWWQVKRSTGLPAPKTSLICNLPCLVKLPPAHLGGGVHVFLDLPFPSAYWALVWISARYLGGGLLTNRLKWREQKSGWKEMRAGCAALHHCELFGSYLCDMLYLDSYFIPEGRIN